MRRYAWLLGLPPLYAAALAAVRPFGYFPLNDDWAYAWSVERLLSGGGLRVSDCASPSLVFQVLCGALWTKLVGLGAFQLRLLTLLFAASGAAFLGLLAERLTKDRLLAAGAALALASSPLYFSLSFTFMSDVYFLALFAAALYFYEAGRGEAGSALSAAALLVRQNGLMIAAGAALARRRARLLVFPLAVFAAWALWFRLVHGPTWASRVYVAQETWRHLTSAGFWPETARRLGAGLVYGGLFAAPLAAAARPRRSEWPLILAAAAVAWAWPLPYLENLLGPHGLGMVSIPPAPPFAKAAGVFASPWLWRALTFAAVLSAGRLAKAWRAGFAWPTALVFAAFLLGARFFDRYTLVLAPGALLAAALLLRERGFSKPVLAAGLALQLALSLAGTADYFRFAEARWRLARAAPGEVDAGYEWNGSRFYAEAMDRLKARRPLEEIGEWDWMKERRFGALISFAPEPGGRRKALLGTAEYRTPLSRRPARLYLWSTW